MNHFKILYSLALCFFCVQLLIGQPFPEVPGEPLPDPIEDCGGMAVPNCIVNATLLEPGSVNFPISNELTGVPLGQAYEYVLSNAEGCTPDSPIQYTFQRNGNCGADDRDSPWDDYTIAKVAVELNGVPIVEHEIDEGDTGTQHFEETLEWNQLNLGSLPTDQVYTLALVLRVWRFSQNTGNGYFSYCGERVLKSRRILVVGEGSTINRVRLQDLPPIQICDKQQLASIDDLTSVCGCNPTGLTEKQVQYRISEVVTNEVTNELSFGLNVEIGNAQKSGNYEVKMGFAAGSEVTITSTSSSSNSLSVTSQTTVPAPQQPGCNHTGLSLNLKRQLLSVFTVNGCTVGEPEESQLGSQIVEGITILKCFSPYEDGICNDVETDVQVGYSTNGGFVSTGVSIEDCTADITVIQTPEPNYLQTFNWFGLNGFVAFGQELTDVPYGIYNLIITSECEDCGEEPYSETVVVCPTEVTYTAWEFNESTGQYCRDLICAGNGDCPGFGQQECIIPEFGEWIYNPETKEVCRPVLCPEGYDCSDFPLVLNQCIPAEFGDWDYIDEGSTEYCQRQVFAEGESTEFYDIGQAYITYDYDEFSETCYRIVRCGEGSIFNEITETFQEDPTYSNWTYDDFSEECYREVYCFAQSGTEVEQEDGFSDEWGNSNDDPAIDWTYNDFDGCVGYVYCDDDDFVGNEFDADQDLEGQAFFDWSLFQDGEYECTAQIYCEYDFDQYNTGQTISEDPEIDQIELITVGNCKKCKTTIQCDDGSYTYVDIDDPIIIGEHNGICTVVCEGGGGSGTFEVACDQICSGNAPLLGEENLLEEFKSFRESEMLNLADKVQITPNPFKERILVHSQPVEFTQIVLLFDSQGKLCRRQVITPGDQTLEIALSEYPNGIYFIRVIDERNNLIHSQKIVKSK